MEFFYVFGLIFLAVFGAAMLAEIFWRALLQSSEDCFDVYVKVSDDIEQFVRRARKSGFIGRIYIIGGEQNEVCEALAEKFGEVRLLGRVGASFFGGE